MNLREILMAKAMAGGTGGNTGGCKVLVLTATDESLNNITANMTLAEAIEAISKHELANVLLFAPNDSANGLPVYMPFGLWCDASSAFGTDCIFIASNNANETFFWTANGFSREPTM